MKLKGTGGAVACPGLRNLRTTCYYGLLPARAENQQCSVDWPSKAPGRGEGGDEGPPSCCHARWKAICLCSVTWMVCMLAACAVTQTGMEANGDCGPEGRTMPPRQWPL